MSKIEQYILDEWNNMCNDAHNSLLTDCPLIEDEVLVEMRAYLNATRKKHDDLEVQLAEFKEDFDDLYRELQVERQVNDDLESKNKAMLQELIDCATELQCSCGHPACKPCQRYGQLVEFIEKMKVEV